MGDPRRYAIAVIPGDGIGREVTPAALEVLEAAGRAHGFGLELTEHPWGCDHFVETGRMMPADALETLRPSDAIFLGAVGRPDVPDHVSLRGLLMPMRRTFDQYVNLRPAYLFAGVPCPLRDKTPGEIDMLVVSREHRGRVRPGRRRLYPGTDDEVAVQTAMFTRRGCERIMRAACERPASGRGRSSLDHQVERAGVRHGGCGTSAFAHVAAGYPDVQTEQAAGGRGGDGLRPQAGVASTWWWRAICSATSSPT